MVQRVRRGGYCETNRAGGRSETKGGECFCETNKPRPLQRDQKRGVFKETAYIFRKGRSGKRGKRGQGGRGVHRAKSGEILSPDTPRWLIHSHIGISTLENY